MRRVLFSLLLKIFNLPRSPVPTNKRGLVIVLIDGLSYNSLSNALLRKQCSFFEKLFKKGFALSPYYSPPPASTTATEAELFFADSRNIPGFTWFDRGLSTFVRGNRGKDIDLFEKTMGKKCKLLTGGSCLFGVYAAGASLCNLSGKDLNLKNPFQAFKFLNIVLFIFFNPLRLILTLYLFLKSTLTGLATFILKRSMKKLKTMLSDSFSHIFLGNTLTYLAELEILRETPILFIDYVLYDELAHAYGVHNKTALSSIRLIDWYCESLFKATKKTQRIYDFVIMSDHGQSPSHPVQKTHGNTLEKLFATALEDSSSPIVKTYGGFDIDESINNKNIYLVPAGSTVQVYFTEGLSKPLMQSDITSNHPHLIDNLLQTTEIGWILVRQSEAKQTLLGKKGRAVFEKGIITEVVGNLFPEITVTDKILTSLAQYALFQNNGDLVLFGNVRDDKKVYSFEDHQGTHGGFYGDMTEPFIITDIKSINNQIKLDSDMKYVFEKLRSSYFSQ